MPTAIASIKSTNAITQTIKIVYKRIEIRLKN